MHGVEYDHWAKVLMQSNYVVDPQVFSSKLMPTFAPGKSSLTSFSEEVGQKEASTFEIKIKGPN